MPLLPALVADVWQQNLLGDTCPWSSAWGSEVPSGKTVVCKCTSGPTAPRGGGEARGSEAAKISSSLSL